MSFLEKYELLKKSVPVAALVMRDSENCELSTYIVRSKNCYRCDDSLELEDSLYTNGGQGNKIVDSYLTVFSQQCYQCVDCNHLYNCTYLFDSNDCTDCDFSCFLNGCSYCFGCVGLTRKKYCIFNKQYTKDEYFRRVKELKMEEPQKILESMFELKQTIPHCASYQFSAENCPYGDYIYNSKNTYWAFTTWFAENSGYLYRSGTVKNSWDLFFSGGNPYKKKYHTRCYELVDSSDCYECAFLLSSENCTNCIYGEFLNNCSDCFGCIGLTNKKYCILNNQLTKEQYEKAVKDIKKELRWKV